LTAALSGPEPLINALERTDPAPLDAKALVEVKSNNTAIGSISFKNHYRVKK
jgi:hypothetical protein